LTEPLAAGSTVGFIGLGAMGRPMATRLTARFPLCVFDVDPAALAFWDGLEGVEVAADPAAVAGGAAAVVLSLPDSAVVEAVVPELLGALSPGALIIDMSSSDPVSTRRLGDRARESGIGFVDAPVSGGVAGAEAGSLTAMVGGQDCDVRAVEPLLAEMTGTRFHVGGPGTGHAVKALNNLLSATGIAITTEAIAIGSRFGVDPARMIEVFNASTGRNWATEYKFPEFVLQDRWDSGFRLGLQRKDLDTALALATATATDVPLATATAAAWRDAESGLGPDADHTEFARYPALHPRAVPGPGSADS
jgi:3-hydroxyisobutyrate dehydrogenase